MKARDFVQRWVNPGLEHAWSQCWIGGGCWRLAELLLDWSLSAGCIGDRMRLLSSVGFGSNADARYCRRQLYVSFASSLPKKKEGSPRVHQGCNYQVEEGLEVDSRKKKHAFRKTSLSTAKWRKTNNWMMEKSYLMIQTCNIQFATEFELLCLCFYCYLCGWLFDIWVPSTSFGFCALIVCGSICCFFEDNFRNRKAEKE